MNLAQKYVYEVFHSRSFSKAAKKLFISQPSLSETVKKLEKELGFSIFDRSKSPLMLTAEGEVYMEYLKEAFENERIMLSRIKSISDSPKRELVIRGGSFLSRTVLPLGCGEFLKAHSGFDIKLDFNDNGLFNKNEDNLKNDFNFTLNYNFNSNLAFGIPLLEEQYFLAFADNCAGADLLRPISLGIDEVVRGDKFTPDKRLYGIAPENLQIMIKDLHINSPELESYVNKIPRSHCRVVNTRHRGVYYDLMLNGIGCIFVTDMIAAVEYHRSQSVRFVPIDNKRTLYAIYKKNRILSDEEKSFIRVLRSVCKKENLLP